METIVLPKKIFREDMVLIPRREYEKFLGWRKKGIKVIKPTVEEKKAIKKGRKEKARGEYISWEELKQGFKK